MNTNTLAEYIQAHGFQAYYVSRSVIRARMSYTCDNGRESGYVWESVPATLAAVRRWLGY